MNNTVHSVYTCPDVCTPLYNYLALALSKFRIPKLSQRSGIIWKLSMIMPEKRLKMISEGIFFSLLKYCIEIFGNVWGLDIYDDQDRRYSAFTKDENMQLQIIMNKVLRSLTGLHRETPVSLSKRYTIPLASSRYTSDVHSTPSPRYTRPSDRSSQPTVSLSFSFNQTKPCTTPLSLE